MASQIKFGSCGLKSDNISRRIRAWGRAWGSFSGWNILKYPARLKLKCVYIKKLYLRENVLKLNIRALSIIIVEGLGGLIDIFITRLCPRFYLIFNPMHIMHTKCIS